ncbi:serine hydrolase domain-containing protein [Rhodococcus sp. NPDC003322]
MAIMRRATVVLAALVLVAACSATDNASPDHATQAQADAVLQVVRETMADAHLKAAIVSVSVDGHHVVTQALGESMPGVTATTDMHFRNGAVAISYLSTLLLQLVDEGKVSLDDKVSTWLPEVPHSERVTLGQLAQMTSGYVDYVIGNEPFEAALYENPFRQWNPEELISFSTSKPLLYEPGTNWNYSHTNYVLLGMAVEKITGQPMAPLMREKVLDPLGLSNTTDPGTPAITDPALHAYTSERREALKVPTGVPFYEESTYWNPSWTLARGAIQTTNIHDLHDTAVAIGSGTLLSQGSYQKMVSRDLIGRTTTLPGCTTCGPMSNHYTYGLGLVITGNWLMQNPMFAGAAGVMAYLPSQKAAIAVAVTYDEAAFDSAGNYSNQADVMFRRIGAVLAPDDAPPAPPQ